MGSGQAADASPGEGRTDATILFADVVDSTRLYEELGDDEARRIILECLAVMEETVQDSGGEVLDRIGDEVLCRFDDPDAAAHAASQLQVNVVAGLADGRFPRAMRIRIGFEHGPILQTEEGLFGTTVYTAARLVGLAKASQTLTTRETLEKLSPLRRKMERFFDRVVLKGQAREQEVHELLWDSGATIVPSSRPAPVSRSGVSGVELTFGDIVKRVDAHEPRIDIGRDSACGLPVEGGAVSRLHLRVSWNRGRVRVEDVSTNGTAIEPDEGRRVALHHESASLSGEGLLRLGLLGPDGAAALIRYRCESDGS
ncbi:MAG: adenylate/guanylate cyclase domain-containing protein [Planctomycetota bacterium]